MIAIVISIPKRILILFCFIKFLIICIYLRNKNNTNKLHKQSIKLLINKNLAMLNYFLIFKYKKNTVYKKRYFYIKKLI